MNQETHNKEFEEAEIIKNKKSKRRKAFDFAQGFAVDQAFERVDGVRKQFLLVIIIWTVGITLGVVALVSLIGWALITLLPGWLAGLIIGILIAPVLWALYFVSTSISAISKKTTIKRK